MKKKIIGWGIALAVVAGAVGAYYGISPVRRFVDRVAAKFGLGGPKEGVTYWCPMHPDIVRKNPGTCPV